MKLVFPNDSLGMGGGARFICQLASTLAARGHDVVIVIPEEAAIVWPLNNVRIKRVEKLSPEVIPEGDFIIPNFFTTVMPAWQAHKGRVVRLSLGYEPLWIKDDLARQTYLIDAPIMAISEWQRQMIKQGTGRDSTVIHGGVDNSIFHPYPKASTLTSRKTIFYISRSPQYGYSFKGADDFWQALAQLTDQVPPFDLNVVHPEPDTLEAPVHCSVWKAVDDPTIARLYAEADLFIFTSYFEAFGLPPLEAMACGTTVVTTDCGGTRDYAQHGQNCLVVPPSDIKLLTEAMQQLLTNDDERQRLAANALSLARTWTWERTAVEVETVLNNL